MWNLSHWKFARNSYFRETQSIEREKKWAKEREKANSEQCAVQCNAWYHDICVTRFASEKKAYTHYLMYKKNKSNEDWFRFDWIGFNRIKSKRNLNAIERAGRKCVRTQITVYLFNVFKQYFHMHTKSKAMSGNVDYMHNVYIHFIQS